MMLIGCAGKPSLQDLARERHDTVAEAAPVVVFLPGTLASVLRNEETGEIVWGGADYLSLDTRTASGLRQMALPLDPVASDVSAAPDPVRGVGVLRRAAERVLGFRFSVDVYDKTLTGLRAAGLRETLPGVIPAKGPTLTPMPYDWRRSIVDGAATLAGALAARGPDAAPVTLLGHSMGGAVALYYLMFGDAPLDADAPPPPVTWAGARHVSKAILVAPPLRGSPIAIRNTINGNRLAYPLLPVYPPSMLATHPSSFELMPRNDTGALRDVSGLPVTGAPLDAALWARNGWGLAGASAARDVGWIGRGAENSMEKALARQAALIARGRAFHAAFDQSAPPPEGLEIVILAGTGRKTPGEITISSKGVRVSAMVDGDGVVPFSSATGGAAEAGIDVITTGGEHAGILSDPETFAAVLDALAQ